MTEASSTTSHLFVVMTTTQPEVTQAAGENSVTSSLLYDAGFYFECAIIALGMIGAAANALIIYAMVASKQHKKQALIVNQNVLDLTSCLFAAVIYSLKICNISLNGLRGYWLCMMLLSENLLWFAIDGSIINLAIITIERYLKVVHHVWSKKKLRKWMIYTSMAFPWVISFVYNMALSFTTSAVIDGVCYGVVVWENHVAKIVHGVWHFLTFYAIILLIFIFCYGRILAVIRRQARVMAGHSRSTGAGTAQPSAAQAQTNQIQSNVIKTMIIVCAFFAVAWLPENVYYVLVELDDKRTFFETGYYAVVFVSFLYICTNPFIYAAKLDPVKRSLLSLIACNKNEQPSPDIIEVSGPTTRNVQKRNPQAQTSAT